MDTPPPVPSVAPVVEDRTVAILSYITIFGFIVAIVMHNGKKTLLGAFHLRQVLGLIITGFCVGITAAITFFILAFIPFIGPFLVGLLWIALFGCGAVVVIMGLISAINGTMKPVPIIGEKIQKVLANTFT